MIWNRFQLALGAGFGCALCIPGCSSQASGGGASDRAGQGSVSRAGASASGAPGAAGNTPSNGGAISGAAGAAIIASAGTSAASAGAAGTPGAAGAAGASASASAGSGAAAVSSPCHARPGLLFCDDFEAAPLAAAPSGAWSVTLVGDGGSVAIDDSVPAHSGSKSVHVHGAGYQALLTYHDAAVLPQTSGKFYVRAFVRLAEAMTGGHNTFVIADTVAAPNSGNALRLGEQNGMLMMTVGGDAHGYLSNQNYYNDQLPGVVFPAGAFTCLELLLDSTHTEIRVWVDGADVPDLHVTDLAHENYDALHFGFEKYAGPEADIWYDDVAIGSERIGCD